MPSCSSKPQATQQNVVIVDLLQEPVKSSISVADKKLRNLEKRRVCQYVFYFTSLQIDILKMYVKLKFKSLKLPNKQ